MEFLSKKRMRDKLNVHEQGPQNVSQCTYYRNRNKFNKIKNPTKSTDYDRENGIYKNTRKNYYYNNRANQNNANNYYKKYNKFNGSRNHYSNNLQHENSSRSFSSYKGNIDDSIIILEDSENDNMKQDNNLPTESETNFTKPKKYHNSYRHKKNKQNQGNYYYNNNYENSISNNKNLLNIDIDEDIDNERSNQDYFPNKNYHHNYNNKYKTNFQNKNSFLYKDNHSKRYNNKNKIFRNSIQDDNFDSAPNDVIIYHNKNNKNLNDIDTNSYNENNSTKNCISKISTENFDLSHINKNSYYYSDEESSEDSTASKINHYKYDIGENINGYVVTKFICDGTFGRVLECREIETGNIYAMKVIRSRKKYIESAKEEVGIINDIISRDIEKRTHIVKVHNSFLFNKNKKIYYCIIFKKLGLSLYEFLKMNDYNGYPMTQIQDIAKKLIEGIAELHKIGYMHTDLKLENILFKDSSYDVIDDLKKCPLNANIKKILDSESQSECSSTQENNEKQSKISKYSYMKVKDPSIKIIDLGSAIEIKDHNHGVINTRQYRAPEVILECDNWDEKTDIWCIGCILVELYTGDLLFCTHNDEEHLCLIEKVRGHYDKSLIERSRNKELTKLFADCNLHKDKHIILKNCSNVEKVREALKFQRTLEESVSSEHKIFLKFLRDILIINPKERPSAEKLLEHKFFKTKFNDISEDYLNQS